MNYDYDLVIIGNTQEAIYATERAVYLKSRVALVLKPFSSNFNPLESLFPRDCSPSQNPKYAHLATLGVDLIWGEGHFISQPKLSFFVNKRNLVSRNFLIATGCKFLPPNNSDLNIKFFDDFSDSDLPNLPENLAIFGNNFYAIKLAQFLAKFGKNISLFLSEKRLLPYLDFQASFWLQCHLESQGLKIFTSSPLPEIKIINQKKLLQFSEQILEVDDVIFADNLQPNLTNLNLDSLKIKFNPLGFPIVNNKLQSSHPNIYFCGDILGGVSDKNIAEYEADIAVKNSLFFPLFSINYNSLPFTLLTDPNIAQVGLTEKQAQKYYGDNIQITCEYLKNSSFTDFAKIITLKDGTILGCVFLGENAGDIIEIIAFSMAKNIKLSQLANFSLNEIVRQMAFSYKNELFINNKKNINLLKTWFNWRKT